MTPYETYVKWLKNEYFDPETRDELWNIKDDPEEIERRFQKELDFGTAGLRGIIGAGTFRMNIYTVRRISFALATLIRRKGPEYMKKGVIIGHDTRNMSSEFAREAASVLAGEGIKTYLWDKLCPVPVLSFSVREMGCAAGIMITASHNPKEYNGYKVYGPDGAQLSLDDSRAVSDIAKEIEDYKYLPVYDYDELVREGRIEPQPEDLGDRYFNRIEELCINKDRDSEDKKNFNVVYTPLHGTGALWVPEILKRTGISNVHVVKEQMIPDGDFNTVPVPNPEDKRVYAMALELCRKCGSDLILATDPDSDRTGVAVRKGEETVLLNGNQIAIVLLNYLITKRREAGIMPEQPFAVSTVVSTRLAEDICKDNGVEYRKVLTGFKFIGEQIAKSEASGKGNFIFGFEESYGKICQRQGRGGILYAACRGRCILSQHGQRSLRRSGGDI